MNSDVSPKHYMQYSQYNYKDGCEHKTTLLSVVENITICSYMICFLKIFHALIAIINDSSMQLCKSICYHSLVLLFIER